MKIGFIAPFDVLSVSSGASNRVFNLAKNLNNNGATVYVLHHGPTQIFKPTLKFLHFRSFSPLQGSGNYLHPINVYFPLTLYKFLRTFNPDIIQCEQPWSIYPTIFLTRQFHIPCVLDEHNVESVWSKYSSKLPFLAPCISALEKYACSQSSLILATSDVDKKKISELYKVPRKKILVITNGADFNCFSKISFSNSQMKKKLGFDLNRKIVLFHGTMSSQQNYEAAQIIVDNISPKISNALFLIIGKNPPKHLLNSAKKQKNVLLLGYVPNIEEYIFASDLCIAPIRRGSGTRLKIIEYIAAGKPIISTTLGAEGLPVEQGVNARLFQDINRDFIENIEQLLKDDQSAQKLSESCNVLKEKLCWENITKPLYKIYLSNFGSR